jgi:hypothetical protein
MASREAREGELAHGSLVLANRAGLAAVIERVLAIPDDSHQVQELGCSSDRAIENVTPPAAAILAPLRRVERDQGTERDRDRKSAVTVQIPHGPVTHRPDVLGVEASWAWAQNHRLGR